MGVKGLAKLIKSTGGQLAHGLQTKDVHVDFMGTFFGLVQAECYKVTSKQASRDFRAEAVATSSCVAPEDQAEAPATTIETVATSSSVAPEDQAEASATTIEAIGATVENTGMSVDATGVTTGRPTLGSSSTTGTDEPSIASTSTAKDPPVASKAGSPRNLKTDISTAHGTKLYIDQDGSISSNAPEKHILTFGHIAKRIDGILSPYLSKKSATLHVDGRPSIQKNSERESRNSRMVTQLQDLQHKVEGFQGINKDLEPIYKKCKATYRANTATIDEVLAGLVKLQWRICQCEYQSDTHIGQIVQAAEDKHNIAIITNDSDLAVYEGVGTITMPTGQGYALTTYEKSEILAALGLESEYELVLTSILTNNDYNKQLPYHTLERNAKIIRSMREDIESTRAGIPPDSHASLVIQNYLQLAGEQNAEADSYEHAVNAFLNLTENYSQDATPSIRTQSEIHSILVQLERIKHNNRQLSNDDHSVPEQDTVENGGDVTEVAGAANYEAEPEEPPADPDQEPMDVDPIILSDEEQRSQARQQKRRWANESHYRSSKFKSPNADVNPRYTPHVVKNIAHASPVAPDELKKMEVALPRPVKAKTKMAPFKKKASKNTTNANDEEESKDEDERVHEKGPMAEHKQNFSRAFKTVSLTIGSLSGCLRRATDLDQTEAAAVVERINRCVQILSVTRSLVFKCIELLLFECLTWKGIPLSPGEKDPMDILLNKSQCESLIRNLISYILNGRLDAKGVKPKKPVSIQTRKLAGILYCALKIICPHLEPTNGATMPLSNPQADLSTNIQVVIRTHFGRLPDLIIQKMLKIGVTESPFVKKYMAGNFEDDETDYSLKRFEDGYIRAWWEEYENLPPEVRPVLCPAAGFADTFQLFQERGLVALLWGGRESKKEQHPTRMFLEAKVCSTTEATRLANEDFGSVFHKLFIGDRAQIRADKTKKQTAYGKKTSTINNLSRNHPESLGPQVLQQHVNNVFKYLSERKEAADETTLASLDPPPLPTATTKSAFRYASSNYIHTNGLVVNLHAYDITRSHTSTKAKVKIPSIETLFPDQHCIRATFGDDLSQISVIGVDPGEHVSAAFCALNSKNPETVSNLLVRRKALYQPVLSYRKEIEKLKCHRPTFMDVTNIHGAMWASAGSSEIGIELPSINEIEASLLPRTYATVASFEDYFGQWLYVQPILHEFYSCSKLKRMKWEMGKGFHAEYQLAINGAMSLADAPRSSLFVYGAGMFNTGSSLASLHTTFKGRFYQSATSMGFIVVSVDEYFTSSKCPTCTINGMDIRLAKPTMRSCVCLQDTCRRWIDRDSVGSHNLAIIGRHWLTHTERPVALRRPSKVEIV